MPITHRKFKDYLKTAHEMLWKNFFFHGLERQYAQKQISERQKFMMIQ